MQDEREKLEKSTTSNVSNMKECNMKKEQIMINLLQVKSVIWKVKHDKFAKWKKCSLDRVNGRVQHGRVQQKVFKHKNSATWKKK